MKNILSILYCCLFLYTGVIGQEESTKKGTESLIVRKAQTTKTIRAVIVGVSNYEDEGIPDLQFAHKDAEAFAEYLKSPSGGSVPAENMKVYLNEEATGGNIHKGLYWLVNESKGGDQCYIYFSGHGDVETIYNDEPGHFLVYDSPSSIYQINSLRLDDLKRIVNTLTEKKKVQTIMVTDACRSGKLAGSSVNGSQATTAALATQFSNEIKIMSCQADEYSVEGKEWGGGRGIFSFHLIEGLIGLADQNENQSVSLIELQRYLEDRFDEDLKSSQQTPVMVGDRNYEVAEVNTIALEALVQEKSPTEELLAFAERQPNQNTNKEEDLIAKFYKAIADKNLLNDKSSDNALDIYKKIISQELYVEKHPIIKGDLIAALQDDAQNAINKYLSLDDSEMNQRWFAKNNDYRIYARYLREASDLLGEFHYLFPQLKAKEIYFEVVSNRIDLERSNANPEAYRELVSRLNEALVFQARSPFIFNERGLLNLRMKKYDEALQDFDEVLSMSPTWALPISNKSFAYRMKHDFVQSKEWAEKAKDTSPNLLSAHHNLAFSYLGLGETQSALDQFVEYHNLNPDNCKQINNIAYCYYKLKQDSLAIVYSDLALHCDDSMIEPNLQKSRIYRNKKKYDKALNELKEAQLKFPLNASVHYNLALTHEEMENFSEAKKSYSKTFEIDSCHVARYYHGLQNLKENKIENAIVDFENYIHYSNTKDKWVYFDNACAFAALAKEEESIHNLEKAIEYGFRSMEEIKKNSYLKDWLDKGLLDSILIKIKE